MAKPEWGLKRTCLSCSTRFYDMQKEPIVCPNCGTEFDPLALVRPRRARAAAAASQAKEKAPAPVKAAEEDSEDIDLDDDDLDDDIRFAKPLDEDLIADAYDWHDEADRYVPGVGGGTGYDEDDR